MKIRVNGAEQEVEAATVAELIASLGLPAQTVLVERNGEALTRTEWEDAPVADGDRYEILRVTAGG